LVYFLRNSSNLKELIWISIAAGLLFVSSIIRFYYGVKSRERYLAIVTIKQRIIIFIPQAFLVGWCFAAVQFYSAENTGALHVWMMLMLIYTYAISFIIIVDCVLIMFLVIFLLRVYASHNIAIPEVFF